LEDTCMARPKTRSKRNAGERSSERTTSPDVIDRQTPKIADHQLLRRIGTGSYGEVWLARTITGSYRAVKVVHRNTFTSQDPYDREFAGLRKFEPISHAHPNEVIILQVGQNPQGTCL